MSARLVSAWVMGIGIVVSSFLTQPATAESPKYGLSTLSSTSSLKIVRPGGDAGKSSIFRRPGSLASLHQRGATISRSSAPRAGSDFSWFWAEALPTAVADRDGVAAGLVRYIDDRRSRGLPVWGKAEAGANIYQRYRVAIDDAAEATGLSPVMIASVIAVESGGVATATSLKGAMGLMQLMPGTAAELGVKKAYDPYQNISGGARYLAQLLDLHKGDFVLALASYNAGQGAVAKHSGVPPYDETRDYVAKVFAVYSASKSMCKNAPVDPTAACEKLA